MKHELPIILGAGIFDSKNRFPHNAVTLPRRVTTYELEYFFEDGGISVLNGVKYPIKSGNILFSKPDDIRYSFLPFKCRFIHFSVSDSSLIDAIEKINCFSNNTAYKKIDTIFSSISSLFYSVSNFDNITASAKLISLLHLLAESNEEKTDVITQAQNLIQNNYFDELTTDSIAKTCNISVSYLHKLFKNELNLTPGEYLTNCRISAARDMLINTDMSVNDVAFRCGFSSQSYFSDCFKRKNGISPKDFRKKINHLP